MADWDWGLVRAQCLREAQGVLGTSTSGSAEDAAQEAAVRAWRRQESCSTPDRPQPWVATIARNEALRIAGRPGFDPLDSPGEPSEDSHEDEVLGQVFLDRAIAGLSGVDREVIRGRYWEDLDYRQLGRLLHVPEGTARVRLHRALGRLRQAMGGT